MTRVGPARCGAAPARWRGGGAVPRGTAAGQPRAPIAGERGQAAVFLVAALAFVLVGALVLGGVAGGVEAHGRHQRAADLGALAGARAMRDAYARLFEPATVAGLPNSAHIEAGGYEAVARDAAVRVARANGAADVQVRFPGEASRALPPLQVEVRVDDAVAVGDRRVHDAAAAVAELTLPGTFAAEDGPSAGAGEYPGPFAYRSGKPMRPDTALAFDRLAVAAQREARLSLVVVSGFRSDAEQAALFAAHPDPKWVAPPGKSLHRLGTELDLGPAAAYGWLDANAERFGFTRRYQWEPWHFGLVANAGSSRLGYRTPYVADRRTSLPSFVPVQYVGAIARAAQRWNVSATLLSAQLYQESGFNPFARSAAGALGIAQFMPGTAAAYGLHDPTDVSASIDAQGHLMHDLLRRFGAVPLALAAYNAGEGRVAGCGCIPPIAETQAYVAAILALMRGAGDPAGAALGAMTVRLVR